LRIHPVTGKPQDHDGIDIVAGISGIQKGAKGACKGAGVKAAAHGRVTKMTDPATRGKNPAMSITIDHGNGWTTFYTHLANDEHYQAIWNAKILGQQEVVQNQRIGSIGLTGGTTGYHLHFEIRKNGVPLPPRRGERWHSPLNRDTTAGVLDGDFNCYTRVETGIDSENESLLTRSVDQFEKDVKNGQGPSLMRAYPTFKLYFIESDSGERKRLGFDDFFSYSSVKDILVIKNRKIPADLCVIQLTNISGALSNKKFGNVDGFKTADGEDVKENPFDPGATNTAKENPIASMMLQPGIEIQLCLGYSSNSEELEKVFNGLIADVQFSENDDLITIVCQSHAVELVQNVHGQATTYGGWFSKAGRTGVLLEEMMSSPEVVHFGKWEGGKAKNTSRGILTDRWTFNPQPQDDNVFAPSGPGTIMGFFDSAPKYVLFKSTIWDVFKEMTYRCPGYIACAVPYEGYYGSRMTMFFGLPNQFYFARDLSLQEQGKLDMISHALNKNLDINDEDEELVYQYTHDATFKPTPAQLAKIHAAQKIDRNTGDKTVIESYMKSVLRDFCLGKEQIKPFRSYHLITGEQHILYNNITSSTHNTFNVATLQYSNDEPEADQDNGKINFDDPRTLTLACEVGIPDEDKRELLAEFPNCVGHEMAKRYGLSILAESLKEGYRGNLIIIGNPTIKPYDVVYIHDEYTDMTGPVEVEQVVHKFSQQSGFITEITPDMCIQINQHSTMACQDAMGLVAEHYLGISKQGYDVITSGIAGPFDTILLHPTKMLGTFIWRKFLTKSQLAHPFRFSPLLKGGKPMLGGFPSKIIDNGFIQRADRWIKDFDENIGLAMDDFYDKIQPSNWAHTSTGSFSKYLLGDF
jgi:hypothetical protein